MDYAEVEQLDAWYKNYLKLLKQKQSSDLLKKKLNLYMEVALFDVERGFSHPSIRFIEIILIPGDPSTEEALSKMVEKAKDIGGIIVKKNKVLLNIIEEPYFKIKTSFPRLEQHPYVKAYIFELIKNLWNNVFLLSDIDQHQAEHNIKFLLRLKTKLRIADELIDQLIKLNQFAGARRKGLRPPTTFAFIEGIKSSASELSSLSFTRHLDISALTLKLLFPDLVKGVSRSAISQKRWRKSKV